MQKLTSLLALTLCFTVVKGQDPQDQQQVRYYLQQISSFEVYLRFLERGYEIARGGLSAIQQIKRGEFSLHADYFNSLKSVSPAIERCWKVADIVRLQLQILQVVRNARRHLREYGRFTPAELRYLEQVWTALIQGCGDILTALTDLTSPGTLSLKQDERLKRIDALHEEMKDRYAFSVHFAAQATALALQRLHEQNDLTTLHALAFPN